MSARVGLALLLVALPATAYQYDLTESLFASTSSSWSGYIYRDYPYVGATFSPSGSLIYEPTVTGSNSNDYEIASGLEVLSGGGIFMQILRANQGTNPYGFSMSTGDYVSAELDLGTRQLTIRQRLGGTAFQLGSRVVANPGTSIKMRSIIVGTKLLVLINEQPAWEGAVTQTTGKPGIAGVGMANDGSQSVQWVSVGPRETVAPTPVNPQTIQTYLQPNAVALQWGATQDDPAGTGLFKYEVKRSQPGGAATSMGSYFSTSFGDSTVQPATTYTYQILATDLHGNTASTSATVTTPAAQQVDSRRVGWQPTGSYWGGGGEQLDTRSGNLNYSIPVLEVKGRGGWSVPVGLSYNSQNWRRDNSGSDWLLGEDTGVGFGWRLMVGSVTPYYTGQWGAVDHYVFTDATGAEFRLDVNEGNVWSSRQAVHVWFDANQYRLYFRDGGFWYMGSISVIGEPDAGSMYPTIVQDGKGNQVVFSYADGNGLTPCQYGQTGCHPNTSSRLKDALGLTTASFTWSNLAPFGQPPDWHIWRATSANGYYQFSYQNGAALGPPFGANAQFTGATTTYLTRIDVEAVGAPYLFTYDSSNSGELTRAKMPQGGYIRWGYRSFTFPNGVSWREVHQRFVAGDQNGTTEWTYGITRSDYGVAPAAGITVHGDMTISDASGVGAKKWVFATQAGSPAWQTGLLIRLDELAATNGALMRSTAFTWSQTPVTANPYISSSVRTEDPGTGAQQVIRTDQAQDRYGNVLQQLQYALNNTATPLRTYNYTYHSGQVYLSKYKVSLPVSITVSLNDPITLQPVTKTLETNYYDGAVPPDTRGLTYPPIPNDPNSWRVSSGISTLYWYGFAAPTAPVLMYPSGSLYNGQANPGVVTFSNTPAAATVFTYYEYGAVKNAVRSDGQASSASADAATRYYAPQSISTGINTATLSYNTSLGVTSATTSSGRSATASYDSLGRSSSTSNGLGLNTTILYATNARTELNGMGSYSRSTVDGLGRTVRVETGTYTGTYPNPTAYVPVSYSDTVYSPCACSPLGKIQRISQPYPPSQTPVWTVYTYDGLGRTVSTLLPDGSSATSYAYSGNQTTITDPAGKWKRFTTDVLGNLTNVLEPDPASTTGGTLGAQYTYDWMGHVYQVSMTRGSITQTRTFVYNDAGLLVSSTNPESGTVTYTYNANNTLQKKQDARGQETVYTYAGAQRLQRVSVYPAGVSGGEDLCQRVTNVFDSYNQEWQPKAGNRPVATEWGTQAQACVAGTPATSYVERYFYGTAGILTGRTLEVKRNGVTKKLESSMTVWPSLGGGAMPRFVTYPSWNPENPVQPMFIHVYDKFTRPMWMLETDNNVMWVQNAQYDHAGRLTGKQFAVSTSTDGNGVTTAVMQGETRGYNAMGQLTSLGWAGVGTLGYVYPATGNNGQISQMTDSISGETVSYQYDSLKRLTSAVSVPMAGSSTSAWNETYSTDGFGNLTGKVLNGTAQSVPGVDGATNRLASGFYDAAGNMTSGLGATFSYDGRNRMVSAVAVNSGVEYYGYAPDNRRVYRKKANGVEEWTAYGPGGEELGQYVLNGAGEFTPVLLKIWFGGQLVATQTVSATNTRVTNPVMLDRLGTNRAGGARFRPYGDEITSTSNDRVKFATYTRDSYTGLDISPNRAYASTYGRFNTADPYMASGGPEDPSSWNRYSYTRGDPVNRVDPSGLYDHWATGASLMAGPDDGCDLWFGCWRGRGVYSYFLAPALMLWTGYDGGGGGAVAPDDEPICIVELRYRPVFGGQNHAYLFVSGADEIQWVLEGEPEHDVSAAAAVAAIARHDYVWGRLLSVPTRGVSGDPSHRGDNPSQDKTAGSLIGSGAICDAVTNLKDSANSFNKSYPSLLYFPVSGPNSNSFAHWLVNKIPISLRKESNWNWTPENVTGWGYEFH